MLCLMITQHMSNGATVGMLDKGLTMRDILKGILFGVAIGAPLIIVQLIWGV